MAVFSDGDFIRNQVNLINPELPRGQPLPLGYDQYTGVQYGNDDLVLNVVDYMLDDKGLMQTRTRDFKLRLLDGEKLVAEANQWKLINVAIPRHFCSLQHCYLTSYVEENMRIRNLVSSVLLTSVFLTACTGGEQSNGLEALKAQYDFAVPDTSSITKVVIRDKKPSSVILERKPTGWVVDSVHPARKDAIEVMLKTLGEVRLKTSSLKVPFQRSSNAWRCMESG